MDCFAALAMTAWGDGLLRGACHRARIRATRWLAMTGLQTVFGSLMGWTPPAHGIDGPKIQLVLRLNPWSHCCASSLSRLPERGELPTFNTAVLFSPAASSPPRSTR